MTVFITTDWCIVQPGRSGLDPADRQVIPQGVRVAHPEVLWRETVPAELQETVAEVERSQPPPHRESEPLTPDEFRRLSELARITDEHFQELAIGILDARVARLVRRWRVDQRMTWRAIARAVARELLPDPPWQPITNQLMGRELCHRAAELLGDDPDSPAWNGPAS